MTRDRPSAHAPRAPEYIDKLLGSAALTAPVTDARELFLHLGYWDDPSRANTDYANLLDAQRRLNDELLTLARIRDGMTVLDVGCGVGGTIATLDASLTGSQLTGLNIDERQLVKARASIAPRGANTVAWIHGDACALPFGEASFDRVLAIECMFHFPSRLAFLREAARVLRADGMLVVSDFVVRDAMRALRDSEQFPGFALEAAIVPAVGPWPDFWADEGTLGSIATSAGLTPALSFDASRATLPSYRSFLRGKHDDGAPALARLDPVDRALVLLEWLQRRGALAMEFHVFSRAK